MTDRTENGLFKPGHAVRGGRNPGLPRAELVAEYLRPHIQQVLDRAIELALAGDPASMRLVMERYSPPAKQEDEKVLVPGFSEQPSLEGKSAAVMQAIASGEISAAAGQRLLQALELHTKIITAGDIELRLANLERGTPKTITVDNATGAVIDDNTDLA